MQACLRPRLLSESCKILQGEQTRTSVAPAPAPEPEAHLHLKGPPCREFLLHLARSTITFHQPRFTTLPATLKPGSSAVRPGAVRAGCNSSPPSLAGSALGSIRATLGRSCPPSAATYSGFTPILEHELPPTLGFPRRHLRGSLTLPDLAGRASLKAPSEQP